MAADSDELNLAKGQEAEPKAGGKKKLIIIVAAVVLLIGAAAGAYFMFAGSSEPAVTAEGEEPAAEVVPDEPEADPIYLSMSPAFIVNFEQDGRTRYLQIDLQIMAYDQEVIDKVDNNMPAVRNGLILLFSDQDYAALGSVEGKEALRAEVLDSINKVIRAKANFRVKEAFFTGFVMQ